jgi:HD-like signal output (HDOD) protein
MYDTVILEYEGRYGRGRTLEDIVSWVEGIPPMPEVTNKALKLIDDPDSTPHEIAALLTRDPGLVSAVMRAANSASLGRAEAVNTMEEAVLVVGLGALKSLLLGLTLRRWNKSFGDIEKLVWEKSLGTSASAFVLATFFGKKYQETARLCGLLHNLGQIVMLSNPGVRRDYPKVLAYIHEHQVEFDEAERQVIGYSHSLVGAMVARKWQLPMSICTTILNYTQPFDGIANAQDEQTALTKLAAALSMCAGLGCPPGHPLVCDTLYPLATALGFKEKDFSGYRSALAKQAMALYTTESNTFR